MNIFLAIILSTLLAIFAIKKKCLTLMGALLAWIMTIIISCYGGTTCFIILTCAFLLSTLIGKVYSKRGDKLVEDIVSKTGKRDSVQIFCNVFISFLMIILYIFINDQIYLIAFASIMAASFSDSLASELGVLSKQDPIDICTFKKTVRGLSGGITTIGTLSSLVGSFLIGLIYVIGMGSNINVLLFITLLGMLGSIIDSLIGSIFQVKYQCIVCSKLTEKKVHCSENTKHIKGIKFLNNDIVNLLNNIIIALIAIILLNN